MLVFYFSNHIQEHHMARFARLKVLTTMIDTGLVPVFYHPNLEVARQVAAACLGAFWRNHSAVGNASKSRFSG